ncbi:sensor histidine kinase KdpD [Desulfuromonas sp. CSMB_57]|uniref:sensor histidine kinase n=1 Tax=Desulfuromonas sp. CSMB_57 TaxID=2807629 RepID=UPI001CD43C20|nr:sensor histidine kinase KdpD [Desulfuromonas sp. CSMB_57]
MEERRPDPDLLLKEAQRQEERKHQGRLKIFFGAAPGVGKTYTMLEDAWRQRLDGKDVVVGYVETHGRFETISLLSGLEIIPRLQLEYRGITLPEMDLDAVLARKPQIALVDELAHTNAPGSRHKKRWQDVFELLDMGINVYTTLNVQHLESLNDVVARITGVVVRETLPDSVLERADEIELVDIPPDELLTRLKEGKVYVADLASRARENFFRVGKLLALRELALRRTAERVDAQMERYRLAKGVREVWPAAERILVCIGANPRSIRLIRAARRMATGLHAEWIAVTVEAPAKVRPSPSDLEQLAEHMRLAESLGAETVTLSGHRASEEILNYARSRNVTRIIIGKPTHPRWKDRLFGSVLDEVVRDSGDIDVYVITGDSGEAVPAPAVRSGKRPLRLGEWLTSVVGVALCTFVASLMYPNFTLADLVMVYLLGIVLTAGRLGRGPTLLATFLSVAAFDFFFIPPFYTFTVDDVGHSITFAVMFIVAFVISRLTLRVRGQAEAARQREWRTTALLRLSRELAHEEGRERLSAIAVRHLSEVYSCQAVVLVPDDRGSLTVPATAFATHALDRGVAQWVFDHRQRAGLGTDTLPGAKALYLPLIAAAKSVGVVGILPEPAAEPFSPEHIHVLESFANQTAMALERAFLAEEAQQALMAAERESLRSTLLSSVSHDLRTPLAAITGAATTLLQQDEVLDPVDRGELLQTIWEEAEHLNRIIRNVLDMTRLESGAIQVTREWQSLEEIVGAATSRMSGQFRDHPLTIVLPPDLQLIPCDGLLIEQVLRNLLENAVKYTPAGTAITLSAVAGEQEVLIKVADQGPGIPPADIERIFEKFVRGKHAGGGVGLGLAICRGIVAAHGGRIWAENQPGGGVMFTFTLPTGQLPPPIVEEPEETIA